MNYAIEVLKEKLANETLYYLQVMGVINDEDCSDGDRDFMRSIFPDVQRKVSELQQAIEVLDKLIEKI